MSDITEQKICTCDHKCPFQVQRLADGTIKMPEFDGHFRSIQRAVKLIHERVEQGQTVTLKDISEVSGYSVPYVSAIFHKNMGIKFYAYVQKCRIDKAVQLINEGMPLSQVRVAVGMTEASWFIKVFRNIMEVTPTQYMRLRIWAQEST